MLGDSLKPYGFELSPIATLMVDMTGSMVQVNARAESLLRYARKDLIGRSVDVLLPQDARARSTETFLGASVERATPAGIALTALCSDGSEVPVRLAVTRILTPDGPFAVAALVEYADREDGVSARARDAVADDVAQVIRALGHDLGEPLRMVSGFSALLERDCSDRLDDSAREYLALARDGGARLQRMVHDLRAYLALLRPEPYSPIDCTTAVSEAVERLAEAIRATDATVSCAPLPTVVAAEAQIVSVFENLLSNALTYRSDAAPVVHVAAEEGPKLWTFAVQDNGEGIAPEHHEVVFELFRTLRPRTSSSGRGVGLAFCRRIVEMHGGRIWLSSAIGEGTTVYFTLPK